LPEVPKELIDQFVTRPMCAEAVNATSMAFKKAPIERALGAELSHHLDYPVGAEKPEDASNHRDGTSGKTVPTTGRCESRYRAIEREASSRC
jgi:putative transposase